MRTLILREAPLFASFFLTSVGNGGNQIARPLFSASFGVSFFFIALVNITGPIANLVGAPLTGILADRWGRRPVIMAGLGVRALSSCLEFFAQSYPEFLLYELLGSFGLAIWTTGATIVIADVSGEGNLGRAVALRTSSQRLGLLCGPVLAGILGVTFGLRSLFLLNAAGKLAGLLIFLVMIRESRPESAAAAAAAGRRSIIPRRADLAPFWNRPVMAALFAAIAVQLISGGGSFEVLFPLHVQNAAGFSTVEIGQMLTITGLATFLIALPNGELVDRFGRKASMLPGLAILALGCYLIATATDYGSVLVAIIVPGIGNGACLGAAQVLSMDLAPEERRGAFLGVWQFLMSLGGIGIPLAVGGIAQFASTGGAFLTIGAVLLLAIPVMGIFGPERPKPVTVEARLP